MSTVCVEEPVKRYLPITADAHYLEVFQNPKAKEVFFDTLVGWGFITKDEITPVLEAKFEKSFWGIAQHLDLLLPCHITEDMVNDLIARMNAASNQ